MQPIPNSESRVLKRVEEIESLGDLSDLFYEYLLQFL